MKEFKEKKDLNDTEIRNTMLPLAVTKPDLYRKLVIVGLIVFYLMAVISYFSDGFLTNYIYLELVLIAILMIVVSKIYDSMYINTVEEIIDSELAGVVIGFSNKLLILTGEEVMDEIDTDEIKIRGVSDEEEETFFSKYTTVLDCFKNGELVGRVGVDRIAHLEGLTLKADMSRASEDLVVVYDDDDLDDLDDDDDLPDDLEDITDNSDGLDLDNLDDLIDDLRDKENSDDKSEDDK